MDAWESHFRDKTRRRALRRKRERAIRAGVLLLLFGSVAVAAWLRIAGVR